MSNLGVVAITKDYYFTPFGCFKKTEKNPLNLLCAPCKVVETKDWINIDSLPDVARWV